MTQLSYDYKDFIQMKAEDLAFALYDKSYYDLPPSIRDTIYEQADRAYWENL